MELTGAALRAAEFGERWRGYDQEEVDRFIEEVAVAADELHARVRDLTDRVTRAEARSGSGEADDTVKRTLMLAQRAADLVVNEAKGVAERTVGDATAQAKRIVTEAEQQRDMRLTEADGEATRQVERRLAETESDHRAHVERLAGEREGVQKAISAQRIELADLHELTQTSRDRLRAALTDHLARLDLLDALVDQHAARGESDSASDRPADDRVALDASPDVHQQLADETGGTKIDDASVDGQDSGSH